MTTPNDFARELVASLPKLRRFALSLTGRSADAEDLVQSACERALKAKDRYEPGTSMDAWMFRIIRNLWIDGIRKRASQGRQQEIDSAFDVAGEDGRQVTEARLTMMKVEQAMAELSSDQQQLLSLICVSEASYQEASEQLGIPIGTVMSRLARARANLSKLLAAPPSGRKNMEMERPA